MTTGHTPHDEQIIEDLLRETNNDDAQDLKAALRDLHRFAEGPAVLPSAGLAALMGTGPASLAARRERKRRHTALTALAVAACMGIGTAAVAATDPGFRGNAEQVITSVVEAVTQGHPGDQGNQGRPEEPATGPAHDPGSPQGTVRVPDLPAPAQGTPGRPGAEPGQSPVKSVPAHQPAQPGQDIGAPAGNAAPPKPKAQH